MRPYEAEHKIDMHWTTDTSALARKVLRWINNFLESFGLDAVKEFKEGVDQIIEHQRKPRWLPKIFRPEDWPRRTRGPR